MTVDQRTRQREIAAERDARGVCIICESDRKPRRYGLCPKHDSRLKTMLAEYPEEMHQAIMADLVDRGMLMPYRQGQRVTGEKNEFRIAAAEFLASQPAREVKDKSPVDATSRAAEVDAAADAAGLTDDERQALHQAAAPGDPAPPPPLSPADDIASAITRAKKKSPKK